MCSFDIDIQLYKYLQETLELQFGTYTGEVQDGKPHGKGSVSFNSEDIQVSRLIYLILYTKSGLPEVSYISGLICNVLLSCT